MDQVDNVYQASVTAYEGTTYSLAKMVNGEKRLLVMGDTAVFSGTASGDNLLCECTPENAAALRSRLPWLNPVPLGRRTSFGFGDRIGLATPGHVAALEAAGGEIAPIFAQQSVRENTRVGRTPQQVVDDAMWGIFAKGWRGDWGADADHVKELSQVASFVEAAYTFYTIDPSDHVDNEAQTNDLDTLRQKAGGLPWLQLEATLDSLLTEYGTAPITLAGLTLQFDEEVLLRALGKYGRALAHTLTLTAEIQRQQGGKAFDLEMSVDETDTPTSAEEHYFIANELLKRQVPLVSLAPRFVGKFQKGVDYMGDRASFTAELTKHAAIMHHFGAYKLSIHTGSDKFSIYGLINEQANGRVHVKTAGTSYLEALRVLSRTDPDLFCRILDLGHERFARDRKTYFLDCRPEKVPFSRQLSAADLPGLLEDFDARQLLHVTFGSALDEYGRELKNALHRHEATYEAMLVAHFLRHLRPFCQPESI